MRALENPMAAEEIVHEADAYLRAQNPREEGLHVSDIVACRRKGWYRVHNFPVAPHSTQTLLLFLMGQGHHSLLEAGESEVHLTIAFDGIRITGSVDKMETDASGETYPAELKTTRAGTKKMKVPSEHYVEQAASYAVMNGSNHARIYVIFLLGDYTGAKLPKIKAWDLFFSEEELSAWKVEMKRRSRVLMGEEIPSLDEHAGWECNYCQYNEKFGGVCPAGAGSEHNWFPAQADDLRVMVEGEEE